MTGFERPFAMGFKDARMYGLDYRDYQKVSVLPTGVPLTAVAGVWGDYANIRCLSEDDHGNRYLRNIYGDSRGYFIRELGVNGKEIKVGTVFIVEG